RSFICRRNRERRNVPAAAVDGIVIAGGEQDRLLLIQVQCIQNFLYLLRTWTAEVQVLDDDERTGLYFLRKRALASELLDLARKRLRVLVRLRPVHRGSSRMESAFD